MPARPPVGAGPAGFASYAVAKVATAERRDVCVNVAVALSEPVRHHPAASIRRTLLLLTLAGLAVRAGAFLLEPPVPPVADERTWTDWARHLCGDKVAFSPLRTRMIFHPPLYPYFLAVPLALTGGLEAARWLQLALASLMVPAVGRVGALAFSPRVGTVAAGITAFYPELVWFSFHFWVENVFLLLLWWALERLRWSGRSDRLGPALAAGLLWGLAVLARETALYFLPVAGVWLLRRRAPGAGGRAAAFLLAALATIAPWTWRNWAVFGAFVPVSTAGGQNLFQGNTRIPRDETYRMVDAVQGRIEQYRYARAMGMQAIRERLPWWPLEKLVEQMPMFWEAESMAVIHVKRRAYGDVSRATAVVVAVVMLAPYLALLPLFALGLAAVRPGDGRGLLLLLLAYYNLIHLVTHGFNRYRLPIMPVVFLLAASAWVAWREKTLALSRARRVVAAVTGAVLLLSVLPSLRTHAGHEAFGLGPDETATPPPAGLPEAH